MHTVVIFYIKTTLNFGIRSLGCTPNARFEPTTDDTHSFYNG